MRPWIIALVGLGLPSLTQAKPAAPWGAALDAQESLLVKAQISNDLRELQIEVQGSYRLSSPLREALIFLPADRYRKPPDPVPPAAERSLFQRGFDPGGFSGTTVWINGARCAPKVRALSDGATALQCPGDWRGSVSIRVTTKLRVPRRYGPFGQVNGTLTLGGGWYPYFARPDSEPPKGPTEVRVLIPADRAAALGPEYRLPGPQGYILARLQSANIVPLAVRPAHVSVRGDPQGYFRFVARRALDDDDKERHLEVRRTLADALRFLVEEKLPLPERPLYVVEAPLRHNLARATNHLVLLSDRAFRLLPIQRAYRFHRFPVLRELFTTYWLRRLAGAPLAHLQADALGAWMVDRYVASRFGQAENAFDILQLWSFIPAVDSLLYAPQLPFVGAFFRLIQEDDPLRPNLIDFPHPSPRGKILYEKLLDRLQTARTDAIFQRVAKGRPLIEMIEEALPADHERFLSTWLGDYPKVQYRLSQYSSRPGRPGECKGRCFVAIVQIERVGEAIKEPLQVRLVDDDDGERTVWSTATAAALRTVTATLGAPLSLVVVDPFGRVAEAPTSDNPSPRFDNRSSPRWRVLLNNFNILLSATAGNIDTAIDLGWSRVRDLSWRFAARASYAPDSLALSTRAIYGFGAANTPNQLSQWIGLVAAGEYLRPGFAGAEEGAFAASSTLFYGYDNRRTAWAPEPGTALRAALSYSHVFGALGEQEAEATTDALALTVRALRSFRFNAAHQVSLRASLGGYIVGTPRRQLLYNLGGRRNVRGYNVGDVQGRARGIVSAEWVHSLAAQMNTNAAYLVWLTGIDGALYADAALISPGFESFFKGPVYGDVGYGLRLYIDYFGVRPGVMAIDVAFPLVDRETGRFRFGPPAVYIDFAQSFLSF